VTQVGAIPLNARVGAVLVGLLALIAITSVFFTPYDPLLLDFDARLQPPDNEHWLGTDEFGRDVLSRLMAAAGTSTVVSLMTVTLSLLLGGSLGMIAGYAGGLTDRSVSVLIDALMSIPALLLALGLMAAVGPMRWGVVIALGIAYSPTVARVVRSQVLSLATRDYVEASRVLGNSPLYTLLRHVVPNCVTPVTVIATAIFGNALLSETALSFLGLGVPPPSPTWGGMMADGREYLSQAPWMSLFPGMAVSIALLGINLGGDALRDRFDPRLERRT
jgi:peptide/nickel transport system permease protein